MVSASIAHATSRHPAHRYIALPSDMPAQLTIAPRTSAVPSAAGNANAMPAAEMAANRNTFLPLTGKLCVKAQPYLPSAMGLGLAWVMPFSNSLAFAIGALLVTVWNRLNKKSSDLYYVPVASGLIAGESLVAALIAIACTVVGLLAAT